MKQKRPLGLGETYVKFCYDHGNGTTAVVAMFQISGPLTADVVQQGLSLLQKRHPLLRASFADSDENHDYFQIDDEPIELPLVTVRRTDPELWKGIYEQYLDEPCGKKKGYLWHATFLRGEGEGTSEHAFEHELVVSFHHSIIDGISLGYFFADLLNYCSTITAGQFPQVESLPLTPGVGSMLKKQVTWPEYLKKSEAGFKQLLKMEKHLFHYEKNVSLDQRKTKFICLETDEKGLIQAINLCRENRATLTSLLSAALLLATHRVKSYGNRDARLKQVAMTPVDMRKRCHSIPEAAHIGCFVSGATTVHTTEKGTSLWPFARSFEKKLKKAIEEQAYFPKDFDKTMYLRMLEGAKRGVLEQKYHLGIGVTNYGILPVPIRCGPFHTKGFYSGATRHWGDWLILMHTASVGGRLYSCFCYEEPLLSRATAEKIVREFITIVPFSGVLQQ